jgi:hypothetical protein
LILFHHVGHNHLGGAARRPNPRGQRVEPVDAPRGDILNLDFSWLGVDDAVILLVTNIS